MTKYIDADKMLKEYEHGIYDTTDLAEMLYYMPAADVMEVRHGRWVYDKGDCFPKCSVCGQYHGTLYEHYYCPVCGAKMDLEENDG